MGISTPSIDLVSANNKFSYFAFISYSHIDEKEAKWFHKKLESFRLPSKILKEKNNLPERVTPVFRDTEDLVVKDLNEAIKDALRESKYLIVLCSPNSAKSEWVNKEIEFFCELGKKDFIIPVSIAGEPFSDNEENESIPYQIKKNIPNHLCIDYSNCGRKVAFIRTVATMLGLHPYELEKRDIIIRRIRTVTATIASILVLAIGIGTLWYNMPHSYTYASYITRFEIPEGLGDKLSKSDISNRYCSYRITKQKGKVIKLETVNSFGNPFERSLKDRTFHEDSPITEYIYSGNTLTEIKSLNHRNKLISSKNLDIRGNLIKFTYTDINDNFRSTSKHFDISMFYDNDSSQEDNNTISSQINTYDENGFRIKEMYYNGNEQTSIYGVFGKKFDYTEEGLLLNYCFLDKDQNTITGKYGYTGEALSYVDVCSLSSVQFFNTDNKPVMGENGYSCQKYEYDTFGNIIKVTHFDENGIQCNNSTNGSVWLFDYKSGVLFKGSYFGTDGKPINCTNGYAIFVREYDSDGNIVKESYFDADGMPINCTDGYAIIEIEYDSDGKIIKESYFGTDGKPINCTYGFAIIEIEYDSYGNQTKWSYFGTDGMPINYTDGCAIVEIEYDSDGNKIKESYFGTDGMPINCTYGYAIIEMEYDSYGNNTKRSYFGTDGMPINCTNGFAILVHEYDSDGNIIKESYFGTDGKPVNRPEGFAIIEMEYDSYGNNTKRSYFGTDGMPINCTYGYAILVHEYDSDGNIIKESYFGTDGKPVNRPEGFAIAKWEYDSEGNEIKESYFGTDGMPINRTDGYAIITWEYDDTNTLIKTTYFEYKNGEMLEIIS